MADDRQPNLAIADDKIGRYLLNVDHAEGGAKARFFIARGFDPAAPGAFVEALLDHGRSRHLVSETAGPFGVKSVFEGPLSTPDGADPIVRSIWHRAAADVLRMLEHRPRYGIQDDALCFCAASSFSESRKPPFGTML